MADFRFTAEFDLEGEEEELRRLKGLLDDALRTGGGDTALAQNLRKSVNIAETLLSRFRALSKLGDELIDNGALATSHRTLQGILRNVDQLEDGMNRAARATKAFSSAGFLDLGVVQGLVRLRTEAEKTARERERSTRESERAATEATLAGVRQRTVAIQQEGARAIAETRRSGAVRVAVIRGISQQLNNLTRLTVRAFSGISRGIGTAFRGALSTVGSNISRIRERFNSETRSMERISERFERELVSGFRSSMTRRESVMATSMNRQESVLRSSVTRQTQLIERLERTMEKGVAGIATGRSRLAGALGIGGLVGGGLGLRSLLTAGFERFSSFERIRTQLTRLLDDGEAGAQRMLAAIDEMARRTPLPLNDLSEMAVGFLSMGVEAQKVVPYTKAIADAIAFTGGSTEQLQRISLAMRQIASTGKLQGDEFNQLAENLAGLNINQLLADQLTGGDQAALLKMRESGKLTADQFLNAFITGLQSDPRIAGSAEEFSNTFTGTLSNLRTAWARLGESIIIALRDPIMRGMQVLRTVLSELANFIKGSGLSPALDALRTASIGAATGILALTVARAAGQALQFLAVAVRGVFTPMGALVTVFAGAGAAIALMLKHSEGFREAMRNLGSAVSGAFQSIGRAVASLFTGAGGLAATGGRSIFTTITETLTGWINSLSGVIDRFANETVPRWTEAIRRFDIGGIFRGSDLQDEFVQRLFGLDSRTSGERIGDRIREIFRTIAAAVRTGIGFVRDVITGSTADQRSILSAAGIDTRTTGQQIGDRIREIFRTIADRVIQGWHFVRDAIRGSDISDDFIARSFGLDSRTSGERLGDQIRSIFNTVRDAITRFWNTVRPILAPIVQGFRDFFSGLGGGGLSALGSVVAAFSAGGPILGTIAAGLSLLNSDVRSGLADLGRAFVSGLAQIPPLITPKLREIGNSITGFFEEAFSGANLANVGRFALRVIEEIGFQLGRIATHPAFVRALVAVGIAAGLVAVRFVEGVIRGIVENIPDLIGMIRDALLGAFRSALTGDFGIVGIFGGLAAVIGGAAVLRHFLGAGRRIGQAVRQGTQESLQAGGGGFGNRLGGFFEGLFGRDVVGRAAAEARRIRGAVATEMSIMVRTLQSLGKDVRFIDFKQNAEGLSALRQQVGDVITEVGRLRVAGTQIRNGIRDVFQSFTVRGVGGLRGQTFLDGLRQIFAGLRTGGRELASQAGIAIALGLSAGFSGQMLAEADSMQAAIGGALGLAGSVAGAFAVGGPALAGVTAGIGLLTTAIGVLGRKQQETEERARSLLGVLKQIGDEGFDLGAALGEDVLGALENLSNRGQEALVNLGFTVSGFTDSLQRGLTGSEIFAELIEDIGPAGAAAAAGLRAGKFEMEDLVAQMRGAEGTQKDLRAELDAAGVSFGGVKDLVAFLSREVNAYNDASGDAARLTELAGDAAAEAAPKIDAVRKSVDRQGESWLLLRRRSQNAIDTDFVDQVNDIVRETEASLRRMEDIEFTDNINRIVRESNDELALMKDRADEARSAIERLFDLGQDETLQDSLDEIALSAEGLSVKISEIQIESPAFRQEVKNRADQILRELEDAVTNGRITSAPQLEIEKEAMIAQLEAELAADGGLSVQEVEFLAQVRGRVESITSQEELEQQIANLYPTAEVNLPATIFPTTTVRLTAEEESKILLALTSILEQQGLNEVEAEFIWRATPIIQSGLTPFEIRQQLQELAKELGIEITLPVVARPEISLAPNTNLTNSGVLGGVGGGGVGSNRVMLRSIMKPADFGLPEQINVNVPTNINPSPISFGAPGGQGKTKPGSGGISVSAADLGLTLINITVPLVITPSPISIADGVAATVRSLGSSLGASFAAGITAMQAAVSTAATSLKGAAAAGAAGGNLFATGSTLAQTFASGINAIRSAVNAAGAGLKGAAAAGASGGSLRGQGSAMGQSYATGVSSASGAARSAGAALKGAAAAGASGGSLFGAGQNIADSFASGIRSRASRAAEAARQLVQNAIAAAEAAAGIGSPSRVFTAIGVNVASSTAAGIRSGIGEVEDAAGAMMDAAAGVTSRTSRRAIPSSLSSYGLIPGSQVAIGVAHELAQVSDELRAAISSASQDEVEALQAQRTEWARALDLFMTAARSGGRIPDADTRHRTGQNLPEGWQFRGGIWRDAQGREVGRSVQEDAEIIVDMAAATERIRDMAGEIRQSLTGAGEGMAEEMRTITQVGEQMMERLSFHLQELRAELDSTWDGGENFGSGLQGRLHDEIVQVFGLQLDLQEAIADGNEDLIRTVAGQINTLTGGMGDLLAGTTRATEGTVNEARNLVAVYEREFRFLAGLLDESDSATRAALSEHAVAWVGHVETLREALANGNQGMIDDALSSLDTLREELGLAAIEIGREVGEGITAGIGSVELTGLATAAHRPLQEGFERSEAEIAQIAEAEANMAFLVGILGREQAELSEAISRGNEALAAQQRQVVTGIQAEVEDLAQNIADLYSGVAITQEELRQIAEAEERVADLTTGLQDAQRLLALAMLAGNEELVGVYEAMVEAIGGQITDAEEALDELRRTVTRPRFTTGNPDAGLMARRFSEAFPNLWRDHMDNLPEDYVERWWNREGQAHWLQESGDLAARALALGMTVAMDESANDVARSARDMAGAAVDAVRDEAQISSPSRVFMNIGRDIGLGLVVGIADTEQDIENVIKGAVEGAVKTALATLDRTKAAVAGSARELFSLLAPSIAPGGGTQAEVKQAQLGARSMLDKLTEIGREMAANTEQIAEAKAILDEKLTENNESAEALKKEATALLTELNSRDAQISRALKGFSAGDLDIDTARAGFNLHGMVREFTEGFEEFRTEIVEAASKLDSERTTVEKRLIGANALSLSPADEAGLRNINAIFDAAEQIRAQGERRLSQGAAVNTVIREMQEWRTQLHRAALELGFNADQLNNVLHLAGLSNEALYGMAGRIAKLNEEARTETMEEYAEKMAEAAKLTQENTDLLNEHLKNVAELMAENLASIDLSDSEVGRENQKMLLDIVEGIRDFADELFDLGVPVDSIIAQVKAMRQQFLTQATALGFNATALNELISMLGLADSQLAEFVAQLKALEEAANAPLPEPAQRSLPTPVVNIYPPYGDPEAIGLAAVNRLALELAGVG